MTKQAFLALLLVVSILEPALGQSPQPSPAPAVQPPSIQTQPPTPQQTPPSDKEDTVRITTNLVQVDAVVTKDGKPVNDLKAEDFEIFEDGHRQVITNFAYVSNVPDSVTPADVKAAVKNSRDKNIPPIPAAPVRLNDPHRIVALVIDDLGSSAESMSQVRRQLRKYVNEQLQPNDLVAIIRTGGDVGALQQFTNDKRVLQSAIDKAQWNICSRVGPTVFQPAGLSDGAFGQDTTTGLCGGRSVGSTMRSLRFILQSMAELPGRKSMVIFSDSIPREEQEVTMSLGEEDSDRVFPSARNYYYVLQKLAEIAIRASVVIYGVDTQGLQYTGVTAADMIGGSSRNMTNQINAVQRSRSLLLWQRREGAELLARETGGFMVQNSNDYRLNRIMEDQQGYYLLGYRPTEETFNRHFHHIKARVKRSGLSLRTRKGFYGISEDDAKLAQRTPIDKTNLALISPFGAHDVDVELTSFFANSQATGSLLRSFMYINAKDLTFADNGDGWQATNVEIRGIIFGNNGDVVDQVNYTRRLRIRAEAYEQALRDGLALQFDMPIKKPGPYQLRVSVRDLASSRIGSAGQFVSVPNLGNQRLALSGIVLGGAVAASQPKQSATASDGPVTDSPAIRRFSPGANLQFACVIYNGAIDAASRRPQLTMLARLFHDGKIVQTSPLMSVDATNQPDLARIITAGLVQLNTDLEPGKYFLQLVVSDPLSKDKQGEAMQWIDFEVVKR
jgi:VWFA-related protein